MSQVSRESVIAALEKVDVRQYGFEAGNPVAAGLIQGLVVRGGEVGFVVDVPPNRGSDLEPLREACEAAVMGLPDVEKVTAVLTAHSAAPEAAPRPSAPRKSPAPEPGSLAVPGIGAIIAVASGKGGVGKSTVAVNLALGLGRLGRRVGLLDADIYGPSIPNMLGLTGKPEVGEGKKLLPKQRYGLKTMSIGYLVDAEAPTIWRGPIVQSALMQLLTDVQWGELDVLVIDMPPGTGDAQLTLAQRVPLAGAVIVSTPQEIALIDARKGLAMFQKTHVPIFGIVENMAWFEDPASGTRTHIFGEGGAKRTAETLGVPFLGEVPLTVAIREGMDAGAPVVASAPESPDAAPFLSVAEKVAAALDQEGAGGPPPPRIIIED